MKEFIIKLSDKFVIPNNITNVSSAEWEIIIKYLSDLFLKHDSTLSKITESEIQQLLEAKYTSEIAAKDERIASHANELLVLKEAHEKQLKKLKTTLEDTFKTTNAEAIAAVKTTLQGTVESKDLLIQNLKEQLSEVQEHLAQTTATTVEPLQEQISNLQRELATAHESYDKQMKKQRAVLEEQYKANFSSILESNKSSLQETIDAKDSIIQALKSQSTTMQQQLDKCINKLNELQLNFTNSLAEEKAKLESRYETKIDTITVQYKNNIQETVETKDSIIQELKTQSSSVQKQLDDYKKQLHELQLSHTNSIAEEKTRLQTMLETKHRIEIKELNELRAKELNDLQAGTLEQLQNTLLEKLDPITKFYGGTNTEKGNGGEVAISDILTTCGTYDDSIVIDVSGQTASGDIIFNWRKMKCLIEVKNKAKLTKEDIDKFIRDVDQSAGKINCAIFVSLQSKHFPGRSRETMQLDYANGIPIIFTYMPPPSKEIHFAIACLERIIQTYETTNNCQEELRQHFINYYAEILSNQKYFSKELAARQKEVKLITKKLEHYNTLCEQLTPAHAKLALNNLDVESAEDVAEAEAEVKDAAEDETAEEATDDANADGNTETLSADPSTQLTQLAEKYIKLSLLCKTPTISMLSEEFGTPERTIERIGFKKITAHAHSLYMSRVITKDRIKKFSEFVNAHGVYPNRKVLLDRKILPDHVIRNITRVTKCKKTLQYIHDYFKTKIVTVETAEDTPIEEPTEDTTVEVVEDTEENNDEPLIELPKKRTSSKPKTSTKTKVKPRRKAPVEEPTEEPTEEE